jgi:hypothetical protein
MKKSKIISLVLITAALASCHKENKRVVQREQKVYMRSDTTADYTQAQYQNDDFWLWYYAFRPYGYHDGNSYVRYGYYSGGISSRSNYGGNSVKANVARASVARGGFGGHGSSCAS